MTPDPTGIAGIADALQEAIVAGDLAAANRIYADDVLVWHNYDGVERDKAESLDAIDAIHREYADFGISDVRRDYLPDGYVQRSVFHAADHEGRRSAIDAMMRVWIAGGRVSRIEEYTDTATLRPPGRHASERP
jgi:ketosteroid isomerase-like protein